jgi:hypothetical protein
MRRCTKLLLACFALLALCTMFAPSASAGLFDGRGLFNRRANRGYSAASCAPACAAPCATTAAPCACAPCGGQVQTTYGYSYQVQAAAPCAPCGQVQYAAPAQLAAPPTYLAPIPATAPTHNAIPAPPPPAPNVGYRHFRPVPQMTTNCPDGSCSLRR